MLDAGGEGLYTAPMTGKGKDSTDKVPPARGSPGGASGTRDARLAAALRQNLLRRKARARALEAPTPDALDTPAKDP